MDTLRRSLVLSPLTLTAMAAGARAQTAPPEAALGAHAAPRRWPAPAFTLDLWPSVPAGQTHPGMKEVVEETSKDPKIHFRRVQGISHPRLSVFPAKHPTGGAMLIIPGGGFVWNYFDHEGYQLADFLAQQGITCFVLFYRLAWDGWDHLAAVGIADAQRAMRVIRAQAQALKIDPARLGVLGFSAGGFLTASLATRHATNFYEPVDAADQIDPRPSLAAPIYAVQSLDPAYAYGGLAEALFDKKVTAETIQTWSPDRNADKTTPPTFLVHAEDDDGVPVANSLHLREAIRAQGVTVETHLFAKGGHGFGFTRDVTKPLHLWPELFVNFARSQGLMGSAA